MTVLQASLIHSLIESYDLTKNVTLINSGSNEDEDFLNGFHSSDYLSILKGNLEEDDDFEDYGLGNFQFISCTVCSPINVNS